MIPITMGDLGLLKISRDGLSVFDKERKVSRVIFAEEAFLNLNHWEARKKETINLSNYYYKYINDY